MDKYETKIKCGINSIKARNQDMFYSAATSRSIKRNAIAVHVSLFLRSSTYHPDSPFSYLKLHWTTICVREVSSHSYRAKQANKGILLSNISSLHFSFFLIPSSPWYHHPLDNSIGPCTARKHLGILLSLVNASSIAKTPGIPIASHAN